MNRSNKKLFLVAKPYLEKGVKKDFLLHTKGVVKAMELILEKEKADESILIPAAILHDIGWSKVPIKLQKSLDKKDKEKAMRLHIEYAPELIEKILTDLKYDKKDIKQIIEIVVSHKFKNPKNIEKRLLIDADTLSDIFKEQFYSDAKIYNCDLKKFYEIRSKNKFYTKTAENIFKKELEKRKKEIFI